MEFPFRLPLVLDGATGTNLYTNGMPQGVCVERWILDNPHCIQQIQTQFVENGSDAIYAPTFSANRQKLAHFGLENEVQAYNHALVALSKQVANGKLVGGDLSPTGLFVQPFGDTSFVELVDIYKQQAQALMEAGVDFFIIETMMTLTESRAATIACKKYHKPIFVTMTVDEKGRTLSGATALSCLITLQELGVSAFGLNCSYGPDKMAPLIKEIAGYAKIPLIAKPNAGQPNPLMPNLYDLSPRKMAEAVIPLLEAGAQIIGGCCGSTPQHIGEIRKAVDSFVVTPIEKRVVDFVFSNETQAFFLTTGNIEFTEPIPCSVDMTDELLEAEEDSVDVVCIQVNTPDDALQFSLNAHMTRLPVAFLSDNELALKSALLLYQGRAMVDSRSEIDPETLQKIAKKYGAVVY